MVDQPFNYYKEKLSKMNGEKSFIEKAIEVKKKEAELLLVKVAGVQEAQQVIQTVAEQVQKVAHERISVVVTRCLETIFNDDPYTFDIIFERKRGKTEARLVFNRDGHEIDPLDASGGGVVDVAAFALRLSTLILTTPKIRKVVIMDEPFKFVSEEYRERVRLVLEDLSVELGIQFIMVTHIPELRTGNIIQL